MTIKYEWRFWSLYRITNGRAFSHVFDCWVEYGGSTRVFTINPRFLWHNLRDLISRRNAQPGTRTVQN